MSKDHPIYVYKIVGADHWQKAQSKEFLPPLPVDEADGYMHFSTATQLAKTLELYFAGQSNVSILAIKIADLPLPLKWEPSRGGDLFPHLYAQLPMACVEWVEQIEVPASGSCPLPARVI